MALPDRPLLIASAGAAAELKKRPGKLIGPSNPKKARQLERLGPQFDALVSAIDAQRATLQADPAGTVFEQVLVLETNGQISDLYKALAATPGFEWLADDELRDLPPDRDFFDREDPAAAVTAHLYLVLFNQEALEQLLSLWRTWSSAKRAKLPKELKVWGAVFRHLREIRRWGVRDRLQETRILEYWRDRVDAGYETVSVEIELWFRSADRRAAGERRVREYVTRAHGQVTATCVVEAIAYHGIVAKLPVATVEGILKDVEAVELLQCDEVRLVRPIGQVAPSIADEEPTQDIREIESRRPQREPVVALLDGLPLENHRALAGRLVVDDPDEWAATYPVARRVHGTAMASLILHGDLSAEKTTSSRSLYVRPILQPDPFDRPIEVAPEGKSWLDLIYRAVHRICEGDDGQPPAAASVRVINLSIGDPYQPFMHVMSPLAKLLDWLAWRYRVLFVVSAGNQLAPIPVGADPTAHSALVAFAKHHRLRRFLSPGEAMHVLTVGATSEDDAGPWTARAAGETDFSMPSGLPSPISGWGRGYRRMVKPDVLAPGGRVAFLPTGGTAGGAYEPARRPRFPPGHKVAAPSASPGDLSGTRYLSGTSNAAALTSRLAVAVHDALEDLNAEPNADQLRAVPTALWIRTLLVHGSSWRPEARAALEAALKEAGQDNPTSDELAGILGFGRIEEERILRSSAERATVLVGGAIAANEKVTHRIPLPGSLNAHAGWRRLTITMSWFSPLRPQHGKYRAAKLWFEPPASPLVVKRFGVDWHATQRGTLQHEVLEGKGSAINIAADAMLELPISCTEDAGQFEDRIPYAAAVTIEVAPDAGVRVYDEIRARIAARVEVRA